VVNILNMFDTCGSSCGWLV